MKKGFTLIELLIVIGILFTLASLIFTALLKKEEKKEPTVREMCIQKCEVKHPQ